MHEHTQKGARTDVIGADAAADYSTALDTDFLYGLGAGFLAALVLEVD
ncbi:hypothetical protein [Rhodococcus erythropolis]